MHPIVRDLQKSQLKKVPTVQAGYTVRVSQKIKEGGKERIQKFEGLVIKVSHGEGLEKTFTVRKIVEGVGVEKIFPFHSPNIAEIRVLKKAKVRRSKLYYMRKRFGKSARLSERQVSDAERAEEMKRVEEAMQAQQAEEGGKAEAQDKNREQDRQSTQATEEPKTEAGVENPNTEATAEAKIEESKAETGAKEPVAEEKAEGEEKKEEA